ncbi:MAG TPA: DinB family protein [Thermoplasmata archaeon]|nr:DinB family protein [Thermoplasmata archaeon]
MRATEVRGFYEYLFETRAVFLDRFREIGWEAFAKPRGASWDSMLAIFLHLLDVEEGWGQIAVRGGALAETPDRKPAAYPGFEAVAADNVRVTELTRTRLAGLDDAALARPVEFLADLPLTRTVERIWQHAFFDELAHVGELIALLWQLDVRPPYVEWLDFRLG